MLAGQVSRDRARFVAGHFERHDADRVDVVLPDTPEQPDALERSEAYEEALPQGRFVSLDRALFSQLRKDDAGFGQRNCAEQVRSPALMSLRRGRPLPRLVRRVTAG